MTSKIKPIPGIDGEWYVANPVKDAFFVSCYGRNPSNNYNYSGQIMESEQDAIDAHNAHVDSMLAAVSDYNKAVAVKLAQYCEELDNLIENDMEPMTAGEYMAEACEEVNREMEES